MGSHKKMLNLLGGKGKKSLLNSSSDQPTDARLEPKLAQKLNNELKREELLEFMESVDASSSNEIT